MKIAQMTPVERREAWLRVFIAIASCVRGTSDDAVRWADKAVAELDGRAAGPDSRG